MIFSELTTNTINYFFDNFMMFSESETKMTFASFFGLEPDPAIQKIIESKNSTKKDSYNNSKNSSIPKRTNRNRTQNHTGCSEDTISAVTVISRKEAMSVSPLRGIAPNGIFADSKSSFCENNHTVIAPKTITEIAQTRETFSTESNEEAKEIVILLLKLERLNKKESKYLSQLNFKESADQEVMNQFKYIRKEIIDKVETNIEYLINHSETNKKNQDMELTENTLRDLMSGDF